MSDSKAAKTNVVLAPRFAFAGLLSTGLSIVAVGALIALGGAQAWWQGDDAPGMLSGRIVASETISIEQSTASAPLLPISGPSLARSPAVFSSAAPLFSVPAAGALVAAGKAAGGSPVRTVEASPADALVAPIKRVKPKTPGTTQLAAGPVTTVTTTQSTATTSVAPVAVAANRSVLPMQPYGLGAGNLARATGAAAEKPTAKAKIVCKANFVLDKVKDACVKRPPTR